MERLSTQGLRWEANTLVKSLRLRLACRTQGYNLLREYGYPLPSKRTLQRHIEHAKFRPGLLTDILEALKIKVSLMKPEERHAVLLLDGMQITSGLVYDHSCCDVLGTPTLPLSDGSLPDDSLAIHGLVFMLGGLSTRWKQTIGYHLTGNSIHAASFKAQVVNIITACESIGLNIHVVVSDMGSANQALWKLFGISVGKHSRPTTSCPHPCDPQRKLWFMADVPHLLKNLRNHLTKGQLIYLPE
ncbi:hypothetical protein HPB49_018445 [Dermacentor silvarum]|uniref:Uncharacterized protein n=1 Tax=Dermacentor silvarum TaxID=543639 RepID=A0ACB8DQI9_DERSI|nr:hypothetical protein HPB49_018445 [Dermacentor silvarum]